MAEMIMVINYTNAIIDSGNYNDSSHNDYEVDTSSRFLQFCIYFVNNDC